MPANHALTWISFQEPSVVIRRHPEAIAEDAANCCANALPTASLSFAKSTRMMTAPDPSLTQVKRDGSQR
jgi:hypothetical protein